MSTMRHSMTSQERTSQFHTDGQRELDREGSSRGSMHRGREKPAFLQNTSVVQHQQPPSRLRKKTAFEEMKEKAANIVRGERVAKRIASDQQKKNTELTAKVKVVEDESKRLREQLAQVESQLETQTLKFIGFEEQMVRTKSQTESMLKTHADLKAEITEAGIHAKAVSARADKEAADNEKLRVENAQLKVRLHKMESLQQELESKNAELQSLASEFDSTTSKLSHVTEQIQGTQKENEDLKDMVKELRQKHGLMTQERREISASASQWEQQVGSLESQIAKLEEKHESMLKEQMAQFEEQENLSLRTLNEQLAMQGKNHAKELEDQKQDQMQQQKTNMEQIAVLMREKDAVQLKMNQLEENHKFQVEKLEIQLKDQNIRVLEVQEKLKEAKKELKGSAKEKRETDKALEAAQKKAKQLQALATEATHKETIQQELSQQLEDCRRELQNKLDQVYNLEQENEQKQQKIAELIGLTRESKDLIAELTKEVDEYQAAKRVAGIGDETPAPVLKKSNDGPKNNIADPVTPVTRKRHDVVPKNMDAPKRKQAPKKSMVKAAPKKKKKTTRRKYAGSSSEEFSSVDKFSAKITKKRIAKPTTRRAKNNKRRTNFKRSTGAKSKFEFDETSSNN